MHILVIFLLALGVASSAQAVDLEGEQQTRYHALTAELRCVICQNRNIAESDAPLAKDMRELVARQIANGRSDREIQQYLVDRYGEWVLYDPPLDRGTLILWAGPFVLLAAGLLIVAVIMRKRAHTPPRALDRDRLASVLDEDERAGRDDDEDSSREHS